MARHKSLHLSGAETLKHVIGFHTCELRGCANTTFEKAPYKSRENKHPHWQWLSTGYYFWTDSDYFARKWGEESIRGDYAIIKCMLSFTDDELLDLVGNVEHQIWFIELIKMYEEFISKSYRELSRESKKPTVCQVIEHFRDKKLFPFIAVKAEDGYNEQRIEFVPNPKVHSAMFLLKRQQLCLFDEGTRRIVGKSLIHPEICA
jgi:hypothetical protein